MDMKSAKNIVADIVGIMAMDIAQIVLLIKSEQRGKRKVQTMDDLISRQAVIDLLKKSVSRDIEEVVITDKHINLIMDMPVAYDVEKVVSEIQKKYCTKCRNILGVPGAEKYCKSVNCDIGTIVDLVRKGGVE